MSMDANVSARINLMRILLISGIVFVHVPYNPQWSPFLGNYGMLDWIRVFLGESLFRIGVPCLSAISGYLLFRRGLAGFDYWKTLKTKARTVLLPFLIWSGSFFVVVYAIQYQGLGFGYLPDTISATPRQWLSMAFALEATPVNLPLYFLRDLMLCVLLSPILALLVSRYPHVTLLALLAYAILPLPNGIFLKKSILFGFSAGIYASLHGVNIKALDRYAAPIAAGFLAIAVAIAVGLYYTGPDFPLWLDMALRLTSIAGIIGSWAISQLLVRTRLGGRLGRGSGLSFWIFCGHYPLLVLFWMIWNRTGLSYYPLFYFTAPLVAIAILVASHNLVQRLAPDLLAVLTGSRTGAKRIPMPAPQGAQAGYSPQQR